MYSILQHLTSTALHCTVQFSVTHCTVLHCTVQCSTLHCISQPFGSTALNCILLHGAVIYTALTRTSFHSTSLYGAVRFITLHAIIMYFTALMWSALHFTALFLRKKHSCTCAAITTTSSSLASSVKEGCILWYRRKRPKNVTAKNRLPLVQHLIRRWPSMISTTIRWPSKVIGVICPSQCTRGRIAYYHNRSCRPCTPINHRLHAYNF